MAARRRHSVPRVRDLVSWSWGFALTVVQWGLHRVPLFRRDREDDDTPWPDLERALPGDPSTLQRMASGHGRAYHRRYWIQVADSPLSPTELIDRVAADPDVVVPAELACVEGPDGEPVRRLEVGDELVVRVTGPWDGPVRVVDRTPTSIRLATLVGHMEAGEIELSASTDERGFLIFQIESWARSGNRLMSLLYDRVRVAREMQLHMWSRVCMRVADLAGGVRVSNVAVATRSRGGAARGD